MGPKMGPERGPKFTLENAQGAAADPAKSLSAVRGAWCVGIRYGTYNTIHDSGWNCFRARPRTNT